jgi:hypothetical protein
MIFVIPASSGYIKRFRFRALPEFYVFENFQDQRTAGSGYLKFSESKNHWVS